MVATTDALSSADTVALFAIRCSELRALSREPGRGEGSLVWDSEGRRFVDFFPGWGCNLLGHCPPAVVQAVQEQVATLIHVPNSWHFEQQGHWCECCRIEVSVVRPFSAIRAQGK